MLAVHRLRADGSSDDHVAAEIATLVDVYAGLPGFRWARAGRSLDEPDLWVLATEWESVGTYRRALSSHAVKTNGHPVFLRIVDEPGTFELLLSTG